MQPCLNPNCKSHGQPHPNCRCHGGMASGGEVAEFCSKTRPHDPSCEYFAEGGPVGGIDFTPMQASPADAVSQDVVPLNFTPDDQQSAKEARHGSLGQQALTAVEGLGKGVAGPLATLAETKLGVKPEDITERAETNPTAHIAGEAAGLIGSSFIPGGQGKVLGQAGAGVAKALGVQGARATAVKMGVENALYTLGDEVSKAIANNPDSIQTAALHVGLSGILGAGVGLPLGKVGNWAEKVGPKAEGFVTDFIKGIRGGAEAAAPAEEGFVPSALEPIKNLPRPDAPLFLNKTAPVSSPASVTAGSKAASKFTSYLSDAAAEAIGGTAGAMGARLTAIPGAGYVGALIGHKAITPIVKQYLPAIIRNVVGSEASAAGLKAAFDAMQAVVKGETLLNTASKALFQEASTKSLDYLIPDHDKLEKLQRKVTELQADPMQMLDNAGEMGHYMPDHQASLSASTVNALNYLNSAHPQPTKPGILNAMVEPSREQMAQYQRTLQIAEQPLTLFSFLKKGNLSPKDVVDVKSMYPGLYPNIVQKVHDSMLELVSKGQSVPFKMRTGLSLLIGQPLDLLMSPESAMAAQATYAPSVPANAPTSSPPKKDTAKLGKSVEMAQTPTQDRINSLQKA